MTRQHTHEHDWSEHAAEYDALIDHLEPELNKATQAMLTAASVGSGTKVLDLACGAGHTTAACAARGADVVGIDLEPRMIEAARRRFPEVSFEVGDILAPPAGPWDAVVCRMGAHHAPPTWAAAAFQVLRPGGVVSIAETEPLDEDAVANGMRGPSHWVDVLQAAGFDGITIGHCHLRFDRLRGADLGLPEQFLTSQPIHIITGQKPGQP